MTISKETNDVSLQFDKIGNKVLIDFLDENSKCFIPSTVSSIFFKLTPPQN